MTGGDSAGGHLAIATQIKDLNDPSDDLTISTKVSALLLHNPYVVLINPKSWIYQIDFKTLPAVWVAYGLKDKAAYNDDPSSKRTERNGESFVKELTAAGIPLRTYIKADGAHGFCSGGVHVSPSTLDKDDFLQQLKLIPEGKLPNHKIIHYGAWRSEHLRKITEGNATLSLPKTLEFPTKNK